MYERRIGNRLIPYLLKHDRGTIFQLFCFFSSCIRMASGHFSCVCEHGNMSHLIVVEKGVTMPFLQELSHFIQNVGL